MTYKSLNSPKDARCILDGAVENIGFLLFANSLMKGSSNVDAMLSEDIVSRLIAVSAELHNIAMEIDNGN